MNRYDYKCEECSKVIEKQRTYEDMNKPLECECGGNMKVTWLQAPSLKGFNKHGSSIN